MAEILIRAARGDEAQWVVAMIHRMVQEVARYGGHAAATAESAWDCLGDTIAKQLADEDSRYLIAESEAHERVGMIGAEAATITGAFSPRQVLEIKAVYVVPAMRNAGLGSRLLSAVLDWGRTRGCHECGLTVVNGNPAIALYRKHGFVLSALEMVRKL
jgi:GNAT superfamily N-acetyltransferase